MQPGRVVREQQGPDGGLGRWARTVSRRSGQVGELLSFARGGVVSRSVPGLMLFVGSSRRDSRPKPSSATFSATEVQLSGVPSPLGWAKIS